jgi:hypothetical protein
MGLLAVHATASRPTGFLLFDADLSLVDHLRL